jgi:nucleoid-associated protein YgaU
VPPSTRESVLKASLTILEPKPGGGTSKIDSVEFPFNPKEWSITHTAEWKTETTKKGTPPPEFKGPKPASASVEIFLDESEKKGGDISTTVAKLKTLVAPEPSSVTGNKPSAPHVLFEWGKAITFKGYVDSVAVKYTMFRGQGTPIRGTVTVAMKEFPQPQAKQNPTSGSMPGHRTHRLVAGDTLASIAYREYGDPNGWRRLAEANGIDDPLRVRDGTVLHVPPA